MPISTSCPNCKALFRLPDDTVGKKVQCQKCATIFVVPQSDGMTTTPGISVPSEIPTATPTNEPTTEKTTSPPPLSPVMAPVATAFADPDTEDRAPARKRPPEESRDNDPDRVKPKPKRRDEPAKSKSSSALTAVVVVLIAGGVFSCILCAVGVGYWQLVEKKPIAKKNDRFFKDVRKDVAVKDFPGKDFAVKDFVKRDDMAFRDKDMKKDFILNEIPAHLIRDGFNKRRIDVAVPAGGIPLILSKEGTGSSNLSIQNNDPQNFDGRTHKQYTIQLVAGKVYQFDMISQHFDAHLYLIDDANFIVAEDDDSGGNLNSRFWVRAPATGEYRIHAAVHQPFVGGGMGNYTVLVRQLN